MDDTNFERELRESLHQAGELISPRERRTEILAMAHDNTGERAARWSWRRWLIPAAAAVSVALVGAIAWGATNTAGGNQGAPAGAPVATTTTTTTPQLSTPGPHAGVPVPHPATSNGRATAATGRVTLPVYFVGANSGAGTAFGLYREFVRTTVPAEASPAQKAKAAVGVAMNAQPFTNYEPYVQPWSGTRVENVTVTPSLITITLSDGGAAGLTADQSRLGVAELVWTAQGAVGAGNIPVKFVIGDGSTTLFGIYPTNKTYNRPTKYLTYQDLAPIWITFPERDQVFHAGVPVVAKGESCAFEATTAWTLSRNGNTVKSGTTMATSGCPARGTWGVSLGKLGPGRYTLRMYEASMAEGVGVVAETSKPFTVK